MYLSTGHHVPLPPVIEVLYDTLYSQVLYLYCRPPKKPAIGDSSAHPSLHRI